MGVFRKILIFLVLTSGIILLGKLAPRLIPSGSPSSPSEAPSPAAAAPAGDTTNALPALNGDTSGGKWKEKLFLPLFKADNLADNCLRRKNGYWEIVFPKGRPIHEYALHIEKTCHRGGIAVERGAELHPPNRSVEYHLESRGSRIKLRASLGKSFLSGSSRLAVVFTELDSLKETQLAALEAAPWDKSLVVNPFSPNPLLKKLRFTNARNELLVELPMEPSTFPYVDPGKHALFIHHTRKDVERILAEAMDSAGGGSRPAAGFVTRYGDRAIENQPLLENVFRYTASKGLAFLDLTGSQRSLSRQTAAAQNAWCRTASPFRDSARVEEELARKAAVAEKTGEAVLVLPYTATGFRNLSKALAAEETHFNELGLELVTFSDLIPPADSATTAGK
jgi:polysaccharide deacetylase 2 family uncharacterized protein YibQ